MGGSGWRIGRIAGTEVRVDSSWIVITALIVFSRWSFLQNPIGFAPTTGPQALILALCSAGLFFGSILLHELGHATLAKARHIEVEGITLWMFGGATHARIDSRGPIDEFLIAVVGPGVSLGISAVLLAASRLLPVGPLQWVLHDMGYINLLLAAFNVLPGFPLDGGRILRSVAWAVTGDLSKATVLAARVGQAFGAVLLGGGLILGLQRGDVSRLWFAVIGWMLLQAATSTLVHERRVRALTRTAAGTVMRPPPPAIPADMPIGQARATYLEGRAGAFPVVDTGGLVGFVSLDTVAGFPAESDIRIAATSAAAAVIVSPADPVDKVLQQLNDGRAAYALVMDAGRLVGVIGEQDVEALLTASPARAGRR